MASLAEIYPPPDVPLVWSVITDQHGARAAENPGWVWIWRFRP